MNKKGFTLVELLATIVIIGLIMALIMPSASRVSKNNKQRIYQEYENMMVEYAKISAYRDQDSIDLFDLDVSDKIKDECVGYVSINHSLEIPTYQAHISCGDQYETPEYDPSIADRYVNICTNCKYAIPTGELYTTWNSLGRPSSTLKSGVYNNYRQLVKQTTLKVFLGVSVNDNSQIERVFACGYRGTKPFCIERNASRSTYEANKTVLQTVWNNTCSISITNGSEQITCTYNDMTVYDSPNSIKIQANTDYCEVYNTGKIDCTLNPHSR